jgi:ABC-type enterobactin transport system permease subunit
LEHGAFTVGVGVSLTFLSMFLLKVKFIAEKSKLAGSIKEIGFSAPHLCS